MNDIDVGHEETVRSSKAGRKNSIFYVCICYFLMKGTHQHMLYWTNDEKTEFEIVYTDKKNKRKWTEKDISLFLDMDSKIPRERDEKGDSKGRFRANIHKLANNGYLKDLGTKKHPSSTSITFRKYRLLEMISKDVLESKIEAINLKAKKTVIEKSNQCREEIKAPSEKSMNQNKRKRSENTCGSLKKLKKSLPTQVSPLHDMRNEVLKSIPAETFVQKSSPDIQGETISPLHDMRNEVLKSIPAETFVQKSSPYIQGETISPLHDMRNEVLKSIPAETFVQKSSPDIQGETVYAEENKRNDGLGAFEDGRFTLQFITIGNYPYYVQVQDTVRSNGLDVCATENFQTNHSDEDNLPLNAIKSKELEFGRELSQENTNQCVSDVYVTVNQEKKEMFESRSETDTRILNPDQFLNLDALHLNKMEYRSDLCQENKIHQNASQLDVLPVNEMDYINDMSKKDSMNQNVFDWDAIPVNEMEYRSDLSELNNMNRSLLDSDAIEPNKMEYRYGSSEQNNINQSALDFDNLCEWLDMDDGNCNDNCK